MNAKAKGHRTQLKAIKLLESEGYLVGKVEQQGRFVKEKDLFGLFDLVAIKDYDLRFVQVTSNKPHSHKKYLGFSKKFRLLGGSCYFQMVYYDRKGWKVFNYVNGKKYVEDNRKV